MLRWSTVRRWDTLSSMNWPYPRGLKNQTTPSVLLLLITVAGQVVKIFIWGRYLCFWRMSVALSGVEDFPTIKSGLQALIPSFSSCVLFVSLAQSQVRCWFPKRFAFKSLELPSISIWGDTSLLTNLSCWSIQFDWCFALTLVRESAKPSQMLRISCHGCFGSSRKKLNSYRH